MKKTLCPFSKPIIGNWCQCQHANMDERCAGKMTCLQADIYLTKCYELVDIFKEKSQFVLGITDNNTELTHMQLMKIRCGGLIGMQKTLACNTNEAPDILIIMQQAKKQFGSLESFPFNEILRDIKLFSHRKRKYKPTD